MKKSGAIGVLTWIIAFSVVFVIILIFYGNIYAATTDVLSKEKCKVSAQQKHLGIVRKLTQQFPLACYTDLTEVRKDGVYVTNSNTGKTSQVLTFTEIQRSLEIKGITSENEINEEYIKRAIADRMFSCWDQFGKGTLFPFEANWADGDTRCIICADISFDESIQEKTKQIRNFGEWLSKTKIPGQEKTYADFLSTKITVQEVNPLAIAIPVVSLPFLFSDRTYDTLAAPPATIVLDQNYVVAYMAFVPSVLFKSVTIGGLRIPGDDPTATLVLSPVSEVGKLGCERLY